jgi:hypothetical protein
LAAAGWTAVFEILLCCAGGAGAEGGLSGQGFGFVTAKLTIDYIFRIMTSEDVWLFT